MSHGRLRQSTVWPVGQPSRLRSGARTRATTRDSRAGGRKSVGNRVARGAGRSFCLNLTYDSDKGLQEAMETKNALYVVLIQINHWRLHDKPQETVSSVVILKKKIKRDVDTVLFSVLRTPTGKETLSSLTCLLRTDECNDATQLCALSSCFSDNLLVDRFIF